MSVAVRIHGVVVVVVVVDVRRDVYIGEIGREEFLEYLIAVGSTIDAQTTSRSFYKREKKRIGYLSEIFTLLNIHN